jgi:CHAT domain-containing protein
MLRSAVALAGAQDTLDAWRGGNVPSMERDGILNAEEAAMLNLNGTWLVVLSSCDSALGEAEPGEGVVGLPRGFSYAGAQAILTTLWPVDDAVTASLVADFYRKAMLSGDAAAALGDVQRDLLVRLRKERGFDEAIRLAGAFVITSTTARKP